MILANGWAWEVFHVDSPPGSPISTHPVIRVELMDDRTVAQKADDLFVLHKSAWKRQRINELWELQAVTSPHALAGLPSAPAGSDVPARDIATRANHTPGPAGRNTLLEKRVIRSGLV